MKATQLTERGQYGLACGDEVDRRIRELLRVKRLCSALTPARELHFCDVLEAARTASVSSIVSEREGALLVLDALGLELCDG